MVPLLVRESWLWVSLLLVWPQALGISASRRCLSIRTWQTDHPCLDFNSRTSEGPVQDLVLGAPLWLSQALFLTDESSILYGFQEVAQAIGPRWKLVERQGGSREMASIRGCQAGTLPCGH